MPEIVEVRKTRDFLRKIMKNKYITSISILKGRYKTHKPFELYYKIRNNLPLKVLDIKSKGKFMYFILENDFYIFSTLGLRGGWTYKLNNDSKKIEDYKFPNLLLDCCIVELPFFLVNNLIGIILLFTIYT